MEITQSLNAAIPSFGNLKDSACDLLAEQAHQTSLGQGTVIFAPGAPSDSLLFLTSGTVRVQHVSNTGRKVVLFRIHSGESFDLITACILAGEDFCAQGVAETDVEATLIPRTAFDELMKVSPEFRAFVFEACSKRITDLSLMIEYAALGRMN